MCCCWVATPTQTQVCDRFARGQLWVHRCGWTLVDLFNVILRKRYTTRPLYTTLCLCNSYVYVYVCVFVCHAAIVGGMAGALWGAAAIPCNMTGPVLSFDADSSGGQPRPRFLHAARLPQLFDRLWSAALM